MKKVLKKRSISQKAHDLYLVVTTSENGMLAVVFLGVVGVGTFGTWLIERFRGENFDTLFESLWFVLVTVTTIGYGDRTPDSVWGKSFDFLLMIVGVALTGALTAKISAFLVNRQMKMGRGLMGLSKVEGHFIICGWKKEMPKILDGIFLTNPDLSAGNVVLINQTDPQIVEDLRADPRFARLHYIYGDFNDENVLLRANIKKAKSILVLADETAGGSVQEIDSRTVMTVMTIENLTKEIYTCAELMDAKFKPHLKLSHCDEIVLSEDFRRILLINASAATGLSHVISSLLDVESPTGLKIAEIPDPLKDKDFGALQDYFLKLDDSLLVGILENTGNIFQRKKEALKEAQMTPDISKLVSNLQSVKQLSSNDPIINPLPEYQLKKHSKAIIIKGRR